MSKHINPKHHSVLVAEIADWRNENLISTELANILIARYPENNRSNAVTLLSIIGAVLVGLGAILL